MRFWEEEFAHDTGRRIVGCKLSTVMRQGFFWLRQGEEGHRRAVAEDETPAIPITVAIAIAGGSLQLNLRKQKTGLEVAEEL